VHCFLEAIDESALVDVFEARILKAHPMIVLRRNCEVKVG
jgi:hypothetical protein